MKKRIRNIIRHLGSFHRDRLVERSRIALKERENAFALMTMGIFTGLPVPPSPLTLELLPLMEEDLIRLLNAAHDAPDKLSDMAALFDGF